MIILFTSATASSSVERNHARRFFFSNHKTSTITTAIEESSYGQTFSKWFDGFLSEDSDKEKQSDTFSKLALLKKFLFSSSSSSLSSSSDKSSKLDKLFQLLSNSAADDKNKSSSNNLQLALKLINLAQGNDGLSSLSINDMKSLIKFAGE